MSLTFNQVDATFNFGRDAVDPITELSPEFIEIHDRQALSICESVQRNPLFGEYAAHVNGALGRGGEAQNTEPWHAFGEQLHAAAEAAMCNMPPYADRWIYIADMNQGYTGSFSDIAGTTILAQMILKAQPFLWRKAIEEIAGEAPLPPHVISRDLMPHPLMFWSREVAYHSGLTLDADDPRRLLMPSQFSHSLTNWMFLMHTPKCIMAFCDYAFPSGKTVITGMPLGYGKKFPDDIPSKDLQATEYILKRLAFLNSPYTEKEEGKLPRPARRRIERAGSSRADQTISVVKLRADIANRMNVTREGAPIPGRVKPDYKGHWWVRGHNRAQWYPSKGAHEVIWIAPYLKGNREGPEIQKLYSVVR